MKGIKITIEIGSDDETYRKQEAITIDQKTTLEIAQWKIEEMYKMLGEKNPECWMEIKLLTIYDLENE